MSVSVSPGTLVNNMHNQRLKLFAIMLLLGSQQLWSAEDETADTAETVDPIIAEAKQAAEDAASRAEDTDAALVDDPAASEDTFTPTIQISEDLSVSFPVDI